MGKLILVVDDEPDIVKITSFRLARAGYDVLTAADGQEALDILQNHRPDLILLDLWMPKLSGEEVCAKIKSDARLKTIPVVILTASQPINVTDKAAKMGAADYLSKPFDSKDLLAIVSKHIQGGQ